MQAEFEFKQPPSPVLPSWQAAALYVGAVDATGKVSRAKLNEWRRKWGVPAGHGRHFIEHLDKGLAAEKAAMESRPPGGRSITVKETDILLRFLTLFVTTGKGAIRKTEIKQRFREWAYEEGLRINDSERIIDMKLKLIFAERFNARSSGSIPSPNGGITNGYRRVQWVKQEPAR